MFRAKAKQNKESDYKLNSIAGKVEFAINNTEIAYQELTKQINEAKSNMAKTQGDPRKVWEAKLKSAQQQLKIVQKIMEHKDVVDMFAPIAIPAIEKIEKGIMGKIKNGLNF